MKDRGEESSFFAALRLCVRSVVSSLGFRGGSRPPYRLFLGTNRLDAIMKDVERIAASGEPTHALPVRNRRRREGRRRQRLPQNRRPRPDAQHDFASGAGRPRRRPRPRRRRTAPAAARRPQRQAGRLPRGRRPPRLPRNRRRNRRGGPVGARPTAVRQAGGAAHADAGRHPRPLSRRRPGVGPRLRLPACPRQRQNAARPARSDAGVAARLGRYATPAARRRPATGAAHDPGGQTAQGRRGAALGAGRRGPDERIGIADAAGLPGNQSHSAG